MLGLAQCFCCVGNNRKDIEMNNSCFVQVTWSCCFQQSRICLFPHFYFVISIGPYRLQPKFQWWYLLGISICTRNTPDSANHNSDSQRDPHQLLDLRNSSTSHPILTAHDVLKGNARPSRRSRAPPSIVLSPAHVQQVLTSSVLLPIERKRVCHRPSVPW